MIANQMAFHRVQLVKNANLNQQESHLPSQSQSITYVDTLHVNPPLLLIETEFVMSTKHTSIVLEIV